MHKNRRNFIKLAGVVAGLLWHPWFGYSKDTSPDMELENPKLDPDLVKQFVANSHGNFEKVKELYAREPLLVFSSHDWGNGDFENGIEAAGHTGKSEIANYLLEKGARINFFTLCMLGKYDLVAQALREFPFLLNAKGPHGFTPLHHAIQGGENAAPIRKLLESLGATSMQIKL